MFTRILIPLDGSILAERAIPHAEQFPRIFDANVILLRVLEAVSNPDSMEPVDPFSWQIRKAEADLYMREIAGQIRQQLSEAPVTAESEAREHERVSYALLEGRIAESIIDFAHIENIDLVVISSHGSGGMSRWNISSTVQKVIDLIYLPVLLIRSYTQTAQASERIHYRHILLPIDSSRRSEGALSAGILLVKGEKMMSSAHNDAEFPVVSNLLPESEAMEEAVPQPKLFLTAVITPPEIPIPMPYPTSISELFERLMKISHQIVDAYLQEMKLRLPVASEICVMECANASTAIHELEEREDVDLVIMSAHGYTGQFTHPYGKVTRSIIEKGTKPILVIQDVPHSQVRPTPAAEMVAKTGRR